MPSGPPDPQAATPAGGELCDHSRSLIAELETVRHRFDAWSTEFKEGPPPPVLDKELVHKHRQQNVFVSRVELVGPEHPDQFICQFALDPEHPFFFEHPLDHVPGLMIIEAARQTGNAVCHLFYDVPLGMSFVLGDAHFDFVAFAELSRPLFGTGTVAEKKFKRGALIEMKCEGHFVQNFETIGFMSVRWRIFNRRVLERMRRSGGRFSPAPSKSSVVGR
jgi:hypothetical protein